MVNLSKMPFIYWNSKTIADFLQRQIIVHSILYYEMSETVIEDRQFDYLCRELVSLQDQMNEQYEATQYYKYFYDFKGETGYYLYDRLSAKDKVYLTNIAEMVLRNHKRGK